VITVVDADGLSSAWLGEALDRHVRLVSCEGFGTGQTSATYRLTLSGPGLPSTLIAKVAAGDEPTRRKVRAGIRAEVGFYLDLLPTVDLRTPKCWYAAVSDDGMQFTLLLEDLAPCLPGVQAAGCSTPQAENAVRNLAALHAPRWNDPALFDLDFLYRPSADRAEFLGAVTVSATEVFVQRYADELGDLSEEDVATLRSSAAAIETWLTLRFDPFSILHGDYRLDNLMFDPSSDDVFAVDWQTAVVGPPARDVAYFLGTCLEIEQRRAEEQGLVGCYHEQLVAHGVTDYPAEQCWEDYRLGQLHATLITTVGAAHASAEHTAQSDGMFLAMARRSCAAIRDLGSLDLLPDLSTRGEADRHSLDPVDEVADQIAGFADVDRLDPFQQTTEDRP
jgi:Ecdysteroid kinase-like family